MNIKDFKEAGHLPTLLAAFLYFDSSFMVWVALGPLMIYITADLGIPVEEKFSLVATPILAGALLRIPLGMMADRIGGKTTGILAQIFVIATITYTWLVGPETKVGLQALGICLGAAGAAFAVALPQAGRWYPPRYQGVVMGIAGAGSIGVVMGTLFLPYLAENYGWQNAFGVLLIPLLTTLAFYVVAAKEAPGKRAKVSLKNYRALLAESDTWWFMFFYSITFGGFVGLANALPLYFTVHYHASGVTAGLMVAFVVASGSLVRPIGGMLADRVGGIRSLLVLFAVVGTTYIAVSMLPAGPAPTSVDQAQNALVGGWSLGDLPAVAWAAVALFSTGALALGMGNGAVFQLIPLRFRQEIGVMTGLVGAAGGVGGFFLTRALGMSKGLTGEFSSGFLVFAGLAIVGLVGLLQVKARWRTTWGAVVAARV